MLNGGKDAGSLFRDPRDSCGLRSVSALPRAEEFAGKLERVDLESVTLLGSDNQRLVIRVDRGSRQAAAPFLGKWVTVDFRTEGGQCQAVRFRSSR